jgi:hypothetical protein
MKQMLSELATNQTILAMLPLVGLSIIVAIVGFFFIYKERRASQQPDSRDR